MAGPIPIPFFGRREELKKLEERCAAPGLTIVKGPPRIGKTRLLQHFTEQSHAAGTRRIGFGQAAEAGGDVLLRAIKDAYAHWAEEAGAGDQLRSIHQQMKGKYISEAGVAFGRALADFAGPAKGVVAAGFAALGKAQKMLIEGGVQLPRLQSEEARDLLAILAHGQNVPIVLVINQWEESQNLDLDVGTLRTFLSGLAEWPESHIVLHLRDPRFPEDRNPEAKKHATGLLQLPSAALMTVPPIDFEEDAGAFDSLKQWLGAYFPGLGGVDDARLLREINGQPGVLEEWSYLSTEDRASTDRLFFVAANARARQFPELWVIYEKLLDKKEETGGMARLELAILLAILPMPADAAAQESVLPAILGSAPREELAWLESLLLLRPESGAPLSLGHPSRRKAAQTCVLGRDPKREAISGALGQRLRPFVQLAINRAIPAFVDQHSSKPWNRLDDQVAPTAMMLAASNPLVNEMDSSVLTKLMCASALSFFGVPGPIPADADVAAAIQGSSEASRVIVSMGLTNAVAHSGSDFERADSLLERLQDLTGTQRDEEAVREVLAKGIFNALFNSDANSERADTLLERLQGLADAHRDDAAIRWMLAKGLFNAFRDSEANSEHADSLLERLQELADVHRDDAAVRGELADALTNAIAYGGSDFERADGLLERMQGLADAHRDNTVVQERLANGLTSAIGHSGSDFERTDDLLERLQGLTDAHRDNAAVSEMLAKGLTNAVGDSGSEFERADCLLERLQSLSDSHMDDAAFRGVLGAALFNAFYNSEANSDRAEGLLERLQRFADAHRDDADLRERLADALSNTIGRGGSDFERADGLLERLQRLADGQRDDKAVSRMLAAGLCNAVSHSEASSERADRLLERLQSLADAHRDDAAVREPLAKGLSNAIGHSGSDFERADGLLERLQGLSDAYIDDEVVRGMLAKGLFIAFDHTEAISERADGLLERLHSLADAHRDDGDVRARLADALTNAIAHSGSDFERADGLLERLQGLADAHRDDAGVRGMLVNAYGASLQNAVRSQDVCRAVEMAERLIPLQDSVRAAGNIEPLIRRDIAAAIDLAIRLNDENAGKRLPAVSQSLFGK